MASGTSRKFEIKLVGVARASLEELLLDCEDFLRQRRLQIWGRDNARAIEIRRLVYRSNKSYKTYKSYIEEKSPEIAANTLICLINQANYLLDRQLRSLERRFLDEGGFTERLYNTRRRSRKNRYQGH